QSSSLLARNGPHLFQLECEAFQYTALDNAPFNQSPLITLASQVPLICPVPSVNDVESPVLADTEPFVLVHLGEDVHLPVGRRSYLDREIRSAMNVSANN